MAVALKLAVLLHRLWVTGEVYEPSRSADPETGEEVARSSVWVSPSGSRFPTGSAGGLRHERGPTQDQPEVLVASRRFVGAEQQASIGSDLKQMSLSRARDPE